MRVVRQSRKSSPAVFSAEAAASKNGNTRMEIRAKFFIFLDISSFLTQDESERILIASFIAKKLYAYV